MGEKRIGVAVSDELGFTAQGLDTIQSKGIKADVQAIIELIYVKNVSEIVIGMPFNMDGSDGPQAQKVRVFIDLLRQATNIPVTEWDERLSTAAAERILLEADMSRAKRRKVIDKLAAVIILQGYLDSKHFQRTSDT